MRNRVIPWLIGVFMLIFAFSGVMLVRELTAQQKEIRDFNSLAALVEPETTQMPTQERNHQAQQPEPVEPETQPAPTGRNLQPLFEKNPDCIGWISIGDTAVNYPVMHTPTDPEKYLHKNFEGNYSAAGVPFLEGLCSEDCDNLILYGHNMKNGTMFAHVTQYRKEEFGAAHPVIELETAVGRKQYTVFAVVRLKADDDWYAFHHATDQAHYDNMVADIKARSLYDLGDVPQYGQQLLTLSTCYGAAKNDRILVIGYENIP